MNLPPQAQTGGLDRLLREAVEAAPIGVAFLEASSRVLFANEAFEAATGLERGTTLTEAGYASAGALAEAFGRLGAAPGPVELELACQGPWTEAVAVLFELDGGDACIVLTNAGDRAALRASEERFLAFMDNAPTISFMVDDADRAVYLSKTYLRAFGFGPEMIGRSAWELFPPDYVETYLGYMHKARDTGEVVTVSVPAPSEDGVAHFLAHYFPMPATSGSLVGGVAIDVTQLVRTQEELAAVAGEQSALLRVATLVAREAPAQDVFALVAEEVARLLDVQLSTMLRFDGHDDATVVGRWSVEGIDAMPTGTTVVLDSETVLAIVRRTRQPARIDSYEGVSGELASTARELRLRGSAAAPILLQERLWGALVASAADEGVLPAEAETRLGRFAELVAQALANSEARRELASSRRRIVQAADDARRRLERDLHDGAQQRLVTHALALRIARGKVRDDPDTAERLLDDASAELALALDELRELARGIHPVLLTERGLVAALEAAAKRASVPVEVRAELDQRLPSHVEVTFYFVASEALANVEKYAGATRATVRVGTGAEGAWIEVADDGVGAQTAPPGAAFAGSPIASRRSAAS